MSTEEPSMLGVAVLSLLEERDMHPYEMIQTLRERKEDQWVKLRTGSLYHQVERLAEAGLARALGTQQEGNRPPRTTYGLTDVGRIVLTRWISAHLTQLENPYFAFSLALAEIGALEPDRAAALLAVRARHLEEQIRDVRNGIDLARSRGAERIWLLAHEHRLTLLTTERDYVADLVQTIEDKELAWPSKR